MALPYARSPELVKKFFEEFPSAHNRQGTTSTRSPAHRFQGPPLRRVQHVGDRALGCLESRRWAGFKSVPLCRRPERSRRRSDLSRRFPPERSAVAVIRRRCPERSEGSAATQGAEPQGAASPSLFPVPSAPSPLRTAAKSADKIIPSASGLFSRPGMAASIAARSRLALSGAEGIVSGRAVTTCEDW